MSLPHQPVAPQWGYHDPRPRLDRLMAQMRAHDPADWGWRPAVVPCIALLVLIVAGNVVSHFVHPHSTTAALVTTLLLTGVLYGALVVAVVRAGRDLVRRYAGWGWTFGLQRPKAMDLAWFAAGVGMAFGGRIAVAVIANAATNGRAVAESQNLTANHLTTAGYLVLAVIVVLIAPFVEELVFRGLLLRTFMSHWGFWPAALVSSAIFAVFHVYEVDTLAGAVTLAGVIFTLGLSNCLLVRWSGRLAAGIMVHAFSNGLGVLVLVLRN